MKLMAGVNFIDVLSATFSNKCFGQLFSQHCLALIFWRKNIGTKDTRKMFMKLTKGQQESDNNNQMILLNDVYTV